MNPSVSVFIDYENAVFVLQNREGRQFTHRAFAAQLLEFSKQYGNLDKAIIWAEWNKYEPHLPQEKSLPAILGELGLECIYMPNPSDRSYIESSIRRLLRATPDRDEMIILMSGDYPFRELTEDFPGKKFLLLTVSELEDKQTVPNVEHKLLWEVLSKEEVSSPIQLPPNVDAAEFFIKLQRLLKEELQRRRWEGMSFHMLARLMVENNLANSESDAQYYINQAVYKGFLERFEATLPSGSRLLFKPTIIEHSPPDSIWKGEEFIFAQLVWAFDLILWENPWWEYVTFSRIREELNKWSLLKPQTDLQLVIESAIKKGILSLSIEEIDKTTQKKRYKYTLGDIDQINPLLRRLPKLIVETVQELLDSNPSWSGVSFSKLLDALEKKIAKEAEKLGSNFWLDRNTLKNWCNFLCDLGVLHPFRGKARLIDGELREPPTLVRVVPDHPWVKLIQSHYKKQREVLEPPSQKKKIRDIHLYRLIVLIEHYLYISDNDAVIAGWMPMATIFKVMGRSLERNFCNAIVRACSDRKIIEIKTFDPRPGQHPPRGAQLNFSHPMIREARKRLLRCLQIFQNLQDQYSEVPLSAFKEALAQDPLLGESREDRLEWLDIMRQENLIGLRPNAPISEPGKLQYHCYLNIRDRYILFLLDSLNSEETLETQQTENNSQDDQLNLNHKQLPLTPSSDNYPKLK